MGHGSYTRTRADERRAAGASGATAFTHSESGANSCHEDLDLSKTLFRESLNSDEGVCTPVFICCDVTGSMSRMPREIFNELPKLGGALRDTMPTIPQISFGALGDAVFDKAPFQVSQFEACDEKIDEQLAKFYLEGGGGGNTTESYECFFYFLGNRVKSSCFDDGRKGIAFLICDESYPKAMNEKIVGFLGGEVPMIPMKDLVQQARSKFDFYVLRPTAAGYPNTDWVAELGEQCVITFQTVNEMLGIIATLAGKHAGLDLATVKSNLSSAGLIENDRALAMVGANPNEGDIVADTGSPVERGSE